MSYYDKGTKRHKAFYPYNSVKVPVERNIGTTRSSKQEEVEHGYTCCVCDKTFTTRIALAGHMRSHK